MDKTFRQFQNEARNNLLTLTLLLRKRRRIFLLDKDFLDAAKNIFEIEKNERIMQLPVEGEKLVKEMKSAKGKAIFFILIKNFWRVRFFLLNQGFVEGTDFVDGFMFLSERHGMNITFDTRPIVQEM